MFYFCDVFGGADVNNLRMINKYYVFFNSALVFIQKIMNKFIFVKELDR